MPELCRFHGITIRMHYGDHLPPHFHAVHSGNEALIEIETLTVRTRYFSSSAKRLVLEWASIRNEELRAAWDRAVRYEDPGKIPPVG